MKIEKEDMVGGFLALGILVVWLLTLLLYADSLGSMAFLWIAMTVLSIVYVYVYKKRGRDMVVLRLRFFVTAVPMYPVLLYYVYRLVATQGLPGEQRFLPLGIILCALFLNGIILYFYEIRNTI